MTWLDSLASWFGDPANVSDMVPSIVVILCTISLIITISVSVRRLGKRIERSIAGDAPAYDSRNEKRSHRRDRIEPVTGPQRSGTVSQPSSVAAPAEATAPSEPTATLAEPTPAPAHVAAPVTPSAPAAPAAPLTPPPAVASVAPPLPPSMTTPPPSAQAFARASALDNDPLNQ